MTITSNKIFNQAQSLTRQHEFLNSIISQRDDIAPIDKAEHLLRIEKLAQQLQQNNMDAIYIHGGSNLLYFTGVKWSPSERVCGAIISHQGAISYIVPHFEIGTFSEMVCCEGEIYGWHEHESPYQLIYDIICKQCKENTSIAIDGSLPFAMFSALQTVCQSFTFDNGQAMIDACRMVKSEHEIKLIKKAMNMTLRIHAMVHDILYPGISSDEVHQFIDKAHQKMGFDNGAYFSIVLFGSDSSFPHGVKHPQPMKDNDVVLIDCGGQLHGYHSDITRTYFYGEPSDYQTNIWQIEQSLCQKAFEAAKLGDPCANIDASVRTALIAHGLGPDYQLPGVAHRTGHGIGLDIHEPPFLVLGEKTILQKGMCFSVEPMICVADEFGIRIEDHIYMDDNGPVWFTEPPKNLNHCI